MPRAVRSSIKVETAASSWVVDSVAAERGARDGGIRLHFCDFFLDVSSEELEA